MEFHVQSQCYGVIEITETQGKFALGVLVFHYSCVLKHMSSLANPRLKEKEQA